VGKAGCSRGLAFPVQSAQAREPGAQRASKSSRPLHTPPPPPPGRDKHAAGPLSVADVRAVAAECGGRGAGGPLPTLPQPGPLEEARGGVKLQQSGRGGGREQGERVGHLHARQQQWDGEAAAQLLLLHQVLALGRYTQQGVATSAHDVIPTIRRCYPSDMNKPGGKGAHSEGGAFLYDTLIGCKMVWKNPWLQAPTAAMATQQARMEKEDFKLPGTPMRNEMRSQHLLMYTRASLVQLGGGADQPGCRGAVTSKLQPHERSGGGEKAGRSQLSPRPLSSGSLGEGAAAGRPPLPAPPFILGPVLALSLPPCCCCSCCCCPPPPPLPACP